jgi:hypothetical protein
VANVTLVNNYYPVTYFATANLDQVAPNAPNTFWASKQEFAPEAEELIYDFGTERPVNFIDFEIAQKPVDIGVYYDDGTGTWVQAEPAPEFDTSMSVQYIASVENPWTYFEFHFNVVQTRYMKLVLTRRIDPFPFLDSDPMEFSIEVRNLRLMHIISSLEEFLPDSGTDILGNTYRTDAQSFPASNLLDGNINTFWQSQPNPTPYAVEALYFDLRQTPVTGTMTVLDSVGMSDLSTRGMADVETYYEDGVLLDEVFIDPITTGPHMHIYYSVDDEPNWDNKLWSPVARHYILKKGFHALPRPQLVKYLKIEFSSLAPVPYNMPEYPQLPQLTYLRYPTWVQNYFNNTYISKPSGDQFFDPYDHVTIDPLELGFQHQLDKLHSGLEIRTPVTIEESDTEIKDFISGLVATQTTSTEAQTVVESTIQFNTSWMWQNDLIAQMDNTRFLSRVAQANETGFNAETTPITLPPPTTQSVADLSQAKAEKEHPIMWFPLRCRHAYQVIKADRPAQVAFFVAIRSITFHRRDYTVPYDEAFYIETFDDTAHQASNDFIQDDWRFVVTP